MVASTQREAITDDPSVVMRSRFAGWSLRLAQVPAASATGRSQLEIDYLRKTFRPQPEPETVVFNGIDLAECSGTPPESQQVGLCAAHCEIVEFIEYAVSDEPDWRDENQGPRTDPKAVTVGDRASNGLDDEETAGFGSISGIRGNCPITRLREESDISLRLGALEERIDFTPRAIAHHVVLRSRLYGFVSRLLRRNVQTTDISRRHSAHQTANRMRGHADGDADRPTFLRRVTAPVILTRSIAELSGLVIGFPAAVIARRRDRRNGVATP
ncbi:MAG: hypothetical protein ABI400_09550 [Lacisediminihabitans sp.]